MPFLRIPCLLATACLQCVLSLTLLAAATAQTPAVPPRLQDFVVEHCYSCHGGDTTKGELDLSAAASDPVAGLWRLHRMRERSRSGEMPPPDHGQLPATELADFVAAVGEELRLAVPQLPAAPGRVTLRRLSRTQWQNCIRDLFGVAVDTDSFPADDLGYGFDTVGDALSFAALHLERYLAAAAAVAAAVVPATSLPQRHSDGRLLPPPPLRRRIEAESMQLVAGPGAGLDGDVAVLYTDATIAQTLQLAQGGQYRLRLSLRGDQAGDAPPRCELRWAGRRLQVFEVPNERFAVLECTVELAAGEHRLELAFTNDYWQPQHPDPKRRDRNLHIDWCEIEGPLSPPELPAAQHWLWQSLPETAEPASLLRAFPAVLLPRVWRRAASQAELDRLQALGEQTVAAGDSVPAALRRQLQAALASPNFLFRSEPGAVAEADGGVVPVPAAVLAQRLAFFLWASAPDEALLQRAARGELLLPAQRRAQVDRLLRDPRSESLATDFAAQWLELRSLAERMPDPARYPGYDGELRQAFRRETELLFLAVLREQRDVRELLDCDFTHVDARLAEFYGLPVAAEPGFVRLALPASHRARGGLLGHASIHAITSNPTRTSPVKRGKWVLEQLLGQPPPPPAPGSDSFADEAAIDSSASLRQQMAQHRERADCISCHLRMDALGFALERYDAIGRYRECEGDTPVDDVGALPDGRTVQGLVGLKQLLRGDPAFLRTVAAKLFVYAIGRAPQPLDLLRLDQAISTLPAERVTLRDLILCIVESDAFLLREVTGPR